MSLENRIASLNDATAVTLLQRFARAQSRGDLPVALDPAIANKLRTEFDVPLSSTTSSSQGELARAALLVISSDPEHRLGIESMLKHKTEQFAIVETTLLISAVLLALQTHLRFERDKQGAWTVEIEKKPTDSRLLKDLVTKLVSFS